MGRIIGLFIGLIVLGVAFGVIEKLWPSVRDRHRTRQSLVTDLTWWAFTPLVGKVASGIFVAVVILAGGRVLGMHLSVNELKGLTVRHTAVTSQPLPLQFVEFLLLADLLGYWSHRAFHSFERLWRIHAVHHSSTELNWLSSVRVHPFNEAIQNAIVAAPLVLVGFQPGTVAAYLPFLTLYAIFIHANVDWDLGPLRYVLASPTFHRWHHSAEADALNKNFSGLLPVMDLVFGTFYMPRDRKPYVFGVTGQPVPSGFLSQLVYPLRRERAPASTAQQHATAAA